MEALTLLIRAGIAHAAFCRADWRRLLKDEYERFEPEFEAFAGTVTDSYPGACGVVRYDVRQHGKIWLGMHQDGSPDTEDNPWLRLSRDEVAVWRLNAAGCALAEKLAGCGEKTGGQRTSDGSPDGGEVDVRIIGDYKAIQIRGREIDLSRKYKARDVLRYLHGKVKNTDGVFRFEEVKEDFNSRFGKGEEKRRWKSDRFREDLFRGMSKEDFDCLFETLDQTAGRYRLKI